MAPHSLDAILRPPQWPTELSEFVTWCLLWDPKARPTSTQALAHAYFKDAADPLRPKSSKVVGRKQSNISTNDSLKDPSDSLPSLTSKTSSWFRKSLIQREQSAPAVPQHVTVQTTPTRPAPVQASSESASTTLKLQPNPNASKRATWTNGLPANAAPIPILPSIRPISPLSNAVTAQATERASKKIGRQLSVASHGNHYTDVHRQEAERALNGEKGLMSPTNAQNKESFFSHLRKRARRFSGRYATPVSPTSDDIEANAGCGPWQNGSNRQSMVDANLPPIANPVPSNDFSELDKALQNVRSSLEASQGKGAGVTRHHSLAREYSSPNGGSGSGSTRPRKAVNKSGHSSLPYDTPDEEEELLDEALTRAHDAARNLDTHAQPQSYLTPASSAHQHGIGYGQAQQQNSNPAKALDISKPRQQRSDYNSKWPTPPYEESEWAAAAASSIFAVQQQYR